MAAVDKGWYLFFATEGRIATIGHGGQANYIKYTEIGPGFVNKGSRSTLSSLSTVAVGPSAFRVAPMIC